MASSPTPSSTTTAHHAQPSPASHEAHRTRAATAQQAAAKRRASAAEPEAARVNLVAEVAPAALAVLPVAHLRKDEVPRAPLGLHPLGVLVPPASLAVETLLAGAARGRLADERGVFEGDGRRG